MKLPEKHKAMPKTREAMVEEIESTYKELYRAFIDTMHQDDSSIIIDEVASELHWILFVANDLTLNWLKAAVNKARFGYKYCYNIYWNIVANTKYAEITNKG